MTDGLEQLKITGLGSLEEAVLTPGRLTVLIGPNGSGKTNILRALALTAAICTGSLQRFVAQQGGASSLLHYGPKHTPTMALQLDFRDQGKLLRYSARLSFAADDRLFFDEESFGHRANPGAPMETTSLGSGHWESQLASVSHQHPEAKALLAQLSSMTSFHFHDTSLTSALRAHARAEDDTHLRPDGSNLAAYLLRLSQAEGGAELKAWHRIGRLVRRVAPAVKTLRPTASHNGTSTARLDWLDDQDAAFGAHHLSDGTLRAIAMITALAQPTGALPRFISIDEPELGLHPAAITLLAELARSVSRHTQVLFATQSATFLDHFDPSEVIVVERSGGQTTLRRLDDNALDAWLEEYSLSQVYDKGLLGGRP